MKAMIRWFGKLGYEARIREHRFIMDARRESGGQDLGATPKEVFLAGLCGCTGMDVISLLTSKFKLPITACEVHADASTSEGGHPVVFTKVNLSFVISGDAPAEQVNKAVELSMTKYCGVSAMLVKACPIFYEVTLNGENIGRGEAHF
ncbi:MAG: OsmC family protein [Bdellovibrionaceae bacterium]|nr:OsmC family protein [Pseudobdellovibrionaceae bacterium]